jgi:hypothetical protein
LALTDEAWPAELTQHGANTASRSGDYGYYACYRGHEAGETGKCRLQEILARY